MRSLRRVAGVVARAGRPHSIRAAAAASARPRVLRWVAGGLTVAALLAYSEARADPAAGAPALSPAQLARLDEMHEAVERYPRAAVLDALQHLVDSVNPDTLSATDKVLYGQFLWRLARAQYGVAEVKETPKETKQKLTFDALATVERAVSFAPEDNNAHRWFGIILSGVGEFKGTKEQILDSFVMKREWERAVELNPKDASAHHLLGRWAFDVAGLSWVKRQLAATLFASPPRSTYEEAEAHFLRAEELDPGFWKKNQVMLARCAWALSRREDALRWLASATKLATRTVEDHEAHAEALALWKQIDPKSVPAA